MNEFSSAGESVADPSSERRAARADTNPIDDDRSGSGSAIADAPARPARSPSSVSGDRPGDALANVAPEAFDAPGAAPVDRSPYLVQRLLETRDENLFNHVKFHLVKQVVDGLGLARPRVLDVGCGLQVAGKYLDRLGLDMDYFGVDYEPRFGPDAVIDLMAPERLGEVLPWAPDVVLLLDVLEHLDEDPAVLADVVTRLAAMLPPTTTIIVTLPQMYRLDRLKLPHLHYPEHKIRLTQPEWRTVLESGLEIRSVQGLGYLSVLPYLPMASRRYTPENRLGRLFAHLRSRTFEWAPLKPVDLWLSNTLGRIRALRTFSNDVLFVASPRRP